MMEISNQNPLSRAPYRASVASGGLLTGMSFEDAMRAADKSTNRMFGFNELGIFGYHAPTETPSTSVPVREPDPDTAPASISTGSVLSAEADAMGTARTANKGECTEEAGPQQAGEKAISAPTFAGRSGPRGNEPWIWLAENCAVVGDVQALLSDAAEATLGCADLAKPFPQTAGCADVRLAMWVEGGRVHLVARDFTLTDEDSEDLAKKLKDALQNHGFALSQLTLNGIAVLTEESNRKDA